MIVHFGQYLLSRGSSKYNSELDLTENFDNNMASRYKQLIRILRWAVELRTIDILFEVLIISQYQASLRKGYLEELYHIFGHLKK